jgi:hypothetical protein
VPHVELSLTDLVRVPLSPPDPLAHWVEAVARAGEPCLVIDARADVIAMSPACVALLGLARPPLGKQLHPDALHLIDFSSEAGALTVNEVAKIPPLLSLSSARLARGLIRVECGGSVSTLDAVAAPIGATGKVAGSLTFLSPV